MCCLMNSLSRNIALLCATIIAFISCSAGGGLIEEEMVELALSEKRINSSVVSDSRVLTVTSPSNWTAKSNKKWVKVTPSSGGKGTCEVKVNIELNDTGFSRSTKVVFSTSNDSESVTVQQATSAYFVLPCQEYNVGYQGGEVAIEGLPEGGYTISIPEDAQEWLWAKGNMLTVGYNNSYLYERSALLSILDADDDVFEKVTIRQKCIPGDDKILPLSELRIDGYSCPTDSFTPAADFFYSVKHDAASAVRAKVEFSGEGVEWITIGDSDAKIYSGNEVIFPALTPGSSIVLRTHTNRTHKTGENILVVTGLPIVTITTEETIQNEPKVDCNITLFDPEARTSVGEEKNLVYYESLAGIEYRGAGALRYPKKPYNFKLKDATGGKVEAKLLGIRNDNSWILDAMYLDMGRMRNRVCFDLWNTFNKPYYVGEKPKAMSGTRGHYVEVFVNGEYMGLFILSDRIDRKQYQIEKQGGYIYKAKGWTDACYLLGYRTPSNDDYYWNSAEIEQEYPDADDGMAPYFNHMADFIDFVSKTSDEEFSAHFADRIAENSVIDTFIFLNLILGYDNAGRNTFWIFRNVNESKKVMHGLWDMDGTLGRDWNRVKRPATSGWLYGSSDRPSKHFKLFKRIIDGDVEGLQQKIYDRWVELKDNQLAPEKFEALVDYYANLQISTGARDREVLRWRDEETQDAINGTNGWVHYSENYGDVEGEATYMKQWYRDRVVKLNSLLSTFNKR